MSSERILLTKRRKIRKPCKCGCCSREFPKGTKITKTSWAEGRTFYYTACCDVCLQYINECMQPDDYISEGELFEVDDYWIALRKELEEDGE